MEGGVLCCAWFEAWYSEDTWFANEDYVHVFANLESGAWVGIRAFYIPVCYF